MIAALRSALLSVECITLQQSFNLENSYKSAVCDSFKPTIKPYKDYKNFLRFPKFVPDNQIVTKNCTMWASLKTGVGKFEPGKLQFRKNIEKTVHTSTGVFKTTAFSTWFVHTQTMYHLTETEIVWKTTVRVNIFKSTRFCVAGETGGNCLVHGVVSYVWCQIVHFSVDLRCLQDAHLSAPCWQLNQ